MNKHKKNPIIKAATKAANKILDITSEYRLKEHTALLKLLEMSGVQSPSEKNEEALKKEMEGLGIELVKHPRPEENVIAGYVILIRDIPKFMMKSVYKENTEKIEFEYFELETE
jgi:hypothetical protein